MKLSPPAIDAREAALGAYLEARNLADDGDGAAFEAALTRFKSADSKFRRVAGLTGAIDYAAMLLGPSGTGLMGGLPLPSAGGGRDWNLGAKVVDSITNRGIGFQAALVSGGSVPVAVPLRREIVTDPRAARFVSDIIPSPEDGGASNGHFSYMRQTVRTNNAAPVAKGTKKPTSVYTVERVNDELVTVAHLSEPIPRQDLSDALMLRQFLDGEMTYGVRLALDEQILNGDGTGAEMTGILAAGIDTVAPVGGLLENARRAITTLEQRDLVGDFFVLNPLDWEAVENEAAAQFASNPNQSTPVDAMARRLYGRGVVTSNRIAAGTGLFGEFATSAELYTDGQGVRIDWSENVYDPDKFGVGDGGSDFEANHIRFRAEGRWNIAVLRPDGFLAITMIEAS